MVNWTAVTIGFVITVILEIIGTFFLSLDIAVSTFIGIFAPIIGGLVSSYMAGGMLKDGAVNGCLAGGMGSFIAAIIVLSGTSLIPIIINSAISGVIGVALGIIGGLIGVLAKGNPNEKEENLKEEPLTKE